MTQPSPTHTTAGHSDARRWLSYTRVLRRQFGKRVYKVGLDAGFTCPNIDGTVARGGCTYCNNLGFSPGARSGVPSITEQMARESAFLRGRYKAEAFIAYFQAYTNTHGRSAEDLQRLYDEALACEHVVGLAVGTRPDCVPDPVLDVLAGYRATHDVMIELGLQTKHDHTLEQTNRWHTFAQFEDAVARAQARGLKVCAHIILGLPGETHADMMATVEALAPLGLAAIKIHLLHILRGTVMARQYERGEVQLFAFDDYVRTVADALERLPASIAIERLIAGAPADMLVAPAWANEKQRFLAAVDAELAARDTRQGARVPAGVG